MVDDKSQMDYCECTVISVVFQPMERVLWVVIGRWFSTFGSLGASGKFLFENVPRSFQKNSWLAYMSDEFVNPKFPKSPIYSLFALASESL